MNKNKRGGTRLPSSLQLFLTYLFFFTSGSILAKYLPSFIRLLKYMEQRITNTTTPAKSKLNSSPTNGPKDRERQNV